MLALTAALKGAEVVMLNRESPRSTAAVEKINAACPTAKVHTVACDLQDFASVRAAAAEVIQKFPDGIDVLVKTRPLVYSLRELRNPVKELMIGGRNKLA